MTTFADFWLAYPKRKGANPKALAEQKWKAAVKKGAAPEHLLSSVMKYKLELIDQNLIDTPYVCMASTWLNQQRWLDYAPDAEARAEAYTKIDNDMASRGYRWNGERWEKINGSTINQD